MGQTEVLTSHQGRIRYSPDVLLAVADSESIKSWEQLSGIKLLQVLRVRDDGQMATLQGQLYSGESRNQASIDDRFDMTLVWFGEFHDSQVDACCLLIQRERGKGGLVLAGVGKNLLMEEESKVSLQKVRESVDTVLVLESAEQLRDVVRVLAS